MTDHRHTHHVYPLRDLIDHVTDGPAGQRGDCPCCPTLQQPCPLCGDDPETKGNCGRCAGQGWVAEQWGDPDDVPTVVVHRAMDGRE